MEITFDKSKQLIISGETKELIGKIKSFDVSKNLASKIFLFVYDYTNSFKNSKTTSEIIDLCYILMKYDIKHYKLIEKATRRTKNDFIAYSILLSNTKKYKNLYIGTFLKNKDYKKNNDILIGNKFLKDILLTMKGNNVYFIIIEEEIGKNKIIIDGDNQKNISDIKNKLKLSNDGYMINITIKDIIKKIIC